MPKPTFFNLPQDKRDRIIDAAITEFGSKPFQKASIAEIIEKADIPRGSFYQYFEDLADLYRHIFQITADIKLRYMGNLLGEIESWDVFKIIRELYTAGLKFAAENPRLAAVGNFYFREDISLKREFFEYFEDQGKSFFLMILEKGQKRGEIDPGVDIDMASLILVNLTNAILEYHIEQKGAAEDLFSENDDYLLLADKMLYIIEGGLRKRKSL